MNILTRKISIHAPPRGATLAWTAAALAANFNSRPSARGDDRLGAELTLCAYFNSRPSARGDVNIRKTNLLQSISIHAPPRGATRTKTITTHDGKFQFTPLREGRRRLWTRQTAAWQFQFTPLREGRRGHARRITSAVISIHAPPRGATFRGSHADLLRLISIHAPPRGATLACLGLLALPCISIHAPPRGATAPYDCTALGIEEFQFTPLREGRRKPLPSIADRIRDFNSRPSARGDGERLGKRIFELISIHAPPRGATAMRT